MPRLLALLFTVVLLSALSALRASPIEFVFRPEPRPGNPFARELWAEVTTPSGERLLLPAFYRGNDQWAVRARRSHIGRYQLGPVTEPSDAGIITRAVTAVSPTALTADALEPLAPIRIDPRTPRGFVDGSGAPFYPLGANFPWAPVGTDPDRYFPETLAAARDVGLNWARVWMAHWGRLNLDWVAVEDGTSPPLGELDLTVAERWDRLVTTAEATGLRLQIVLQHHGQYSSKVNSNWDINPWNVANGGFLANPTEFFTSDRARTYTRQKYRYIVARWGYSPAIFAWELFNEVHWTDARAGTRASNAAVTAWHAEMARLIRQVDPYPHLVTTSDDSLRHPLQAVADFLQPHLYAANMLAGVQRFDVDPAQLDRPIFYGEVGDDNVDSLPPELRHNGYSNLPLAWAGLMSSSPHAAQLWYAQRMIEHGRFGELRALTRFIAATGLDRRHDLRYFTPTVSGSDRVPLTILPGAHWHRMAPPTVSVPLDGRAPADVAKIPRTLVWDDPAAREDDPFPHEMTLQLDYRRDATAVLRFAGASPQGGSVQVSLDGVRVGERDWPVQTSATAAPPPPAPVEFLLPMKAGRRTLTITNPRGPDWVEFGSLSTGVDVPALAATGRRADDAIVLWVYHRAGVFSLDEVTPARATLQLEDVAAGEWAVTWWNTTTGEPQPVERVRHGGGTLALPTPPVTRFTAVSLERE